MRCNGQPFVQRATLVGFEMAPTDPAQVSGVEHFGDTFAHFREHSPKSRMKEQGLLIFNQEMIELEI